MKRFVGILAALEIINGISLAAFPMMSVTWLLGDVPGDVGEVLSRFGGIVLVGLGMACLPSEEDTEGSLVRPVIGLMVYHAFAAIFLGYSGLQLELMGKMFWPVILFHAVLTVLLAVWLAGRKRNKVSAEKYPELQ